MQRVFDIFFSFLGIVILFPLIITLVIILKFTGEKEVLYIQNRIGLHGKHFGLLKFATMLKNSPNIGAGEITVQNDPRVLPFGNFLRKTKLNELPQLWNILIGDMSIVGPRPMVPNTFYFYSVSVQKKLYKTRPGLTGIGSIVFRNEEIFLNNRKDAMQFYQQNIAPYKGLLETWYINNNSLILYFKIIIITFFVVLFPKRNLAERYFKGLPKRPTILNI